MDVDNQGVVWRVFECYREAKRIEAAAGAALPAGWARITIAAPDALIRKFQTEAASAAADAGHPSGSGRSDPPRGQDAAKAAE